MTKAVSVTVTGRVQGVAFRWYAVQEAERLGVAGWVRNEPDESVAGSLRGRRRRRRRDGRPGAASDRRTPPVRHVAVTEARPTGATGFDIRY